MVNKIKKRLRLWVQIVFTAISNGYLIGFFHGKIFDGASKQLCVPGLNCYSCPGALGSCPIGALQAVLADKDYKVSFYVIGFLMMVGAFLGRFVCGWLCPFGLVQDILHKIPLPFKRKSLPGHKYLIYAKYIILIVFVILLPAFVTNMFGLGSPWFCQYICPSGTLFAGIPLVVLNDSLQNAIGLLFSWKFLILVVIAIASIFIYRPFCKYLCPLGAIYGFFNKISLYRMDVEKSRCTNCGKCQSICKMDINVCKSPNSIECIRCGECIKACPEKAIYDSVNRRKKND